MKARRVYKHVTPFGGVVPILKTLREYGVPQLINKCLGKRPKQSRYAYSDTLIGWTVATLCGGSSLSHISKYKKKLSIIPGLKVPSHDTLGRVMKKLSEEVKTTHSVTHKAKASIVYSDYDDNLKMNNMLIKTTKRIKALQENRSYTMDIDATFVPTECRGAIRKYDKKGRLDYNKIGFNPMVCLIGDLPVFFSMRNGDANSKFRFKECLNDSLRLLGESKIKVSRVISDAAGYHRGALDMLDSKGIKFNVRFPYAKNMETFNTNLRSSKNWRPTVIETANFYWDCDIADIPYKMWDYKFANAPQTAKTWRVVAIRMPTNETFRRIENPDKVLQREQVRNKMFQFRKKNLLKEPGKAYTDNHWKEINGYLYKFFITNDFVKTSEGIVLEYNQRGTAERKFSFMKRDYAWRLPPFMNMNENTVFMIAAALANNMFRGMVNLFKKEIPQLRLNARLPDFRETFIFVQCERLIDGTFEFCNTDISFEKIV